MANAKKLPSGTWRIRVYDRSAKKYKSFTGATRREAEEKAAAFRLKNRKTKSLAGDPTVGKAVKDYIDNRSNINAPSGIRSYYDIYDHSIDEIKDIRVSELTEIDLQKWINTNAAVYSPKTLQSQFGLVRAALRSVKAELDFTMIKCPKVIEKERPIPDEEAIAIILKMVEGTTIELAVTMAITLGMRIGEAAAIKWQDYDGKSLLVHAEYTLNKDGKYEYQERTKSSASYRRLKVNGILKERLDLTERKEEFVSMMLPSSILKKFHRLCDDNGLPKYRLHDLRHAFASQMLINGVPDKYAMAMLGQSTTSMLKKVYQHLYDDKKSEYADTMGNIFRQIYDTKYDTKNER